VIDNLGGSKAGGGYPVRRLCTFFGYSTQAYYKSQSDTRMDTGSLLPILCSHAILQRKKIPSIGCRKIYWTLDDSWPYGRDKTERMLIELGFRVRYIRNRIRTTYAGSIRLPNLIKGLKINGINQVWQSDMTYFFMDNGELAYLIFIVDVYSQRIIAHGAYLHYPAKVFCEVLKGAFHTRKGYSLLGTIHHSDAGAQYGSDLYRTTLTSKQMIQSMCKYSWENPYAEKVNDIIKNGYLQHWKPSNHRQLIRMLNKAVKTYNHMQFKTTLGMRTPIAYEQWIQSKPVDQRPVKTLKPIKSQVITYQNQSFNDLYS
jgi:transposase InsO family protein